MISTDMPWLTENQLYPHIKYVMDKFKGKLPKDDLKRFAKEVGLYRMGRFIAS